MDSDGARGGSTGSSASQLWTGEGSRGRKVLILSYYFPPLAGPASTRVLGLARHLPPMGWEPTVVTVEGSRSVSTDASLTIPPEIQVIRARSVEPHRLYGSLTGEKGPLPSAHMSSTPAGATDRVLRWLRNNIALPDARVGWIPGAYHAARRLLKQEAFDCIYTTSPPHSLQLTGRCLSRSSGIPWVAELRDPWTGIEYNIDSNRTSVARRIDRWMEKKCILDSNHVVTTSEGLRDTLLKKHKLPDPGKVSVVVNGLDPDEIPPAKNPPSDRFRILHLGSLPSPRSPRTFMKALGGLLKDIPQLREHLELAFVGKVADGVKEDLERFGLLPFCRFLTPATRPAALTELQDASLFLLPLPEGEESSQIVPAKTMEYMASRKPILAFAYPGHEVDRILKNWCGEGAIAHNDVEETNRRIKKHYADSIGKDSALLPKLSPEFHRERLAKKMAGIFDRVREQTGQTTRATTGVVR